MTQGRLSPLAKAAGLEGDPLVIQLEPALLQPTGLTSSGFPYLRRPAWEAFRDGVPHLLGMGLDVLRRLDALREALGAKPESPERENLTRSLKVARQVVLTAAITAPPDLWLLRHVLGFLAELGLTDRLLAGEAIYPESCAVTWDGREHTLQADELDTDLHFLLSRGVVEQYDNSFRVAGHPRARRLLESIEPVSVTVSAGVPVSATRLWRRLFSGETLEASEQEALLELTSAVRKRTDPRQNHWIPTLEEVELGYRLVPVVLGLRAAELTGRLKTGTELGPTDWSQSNPGCATGALEVLTAAGWTERTGERFRVTALGARGFARGPGPFGVIETYHAYMAKGREILLHGRGDGVWVQRGENVGASQDANRRTFERANAALDRFCTDTGHDLKVFVEHAIGRGEATRQRFALSGATLRYFGADLEDAAIDAAMAEQARGVLPADMVFVRNADIGRADVLLSALSEAGANPEGAVMLVGNGFHEVRGQSDEGMIEVFRSYEDAGILLLFTEENALAIDDLRATAWNTYHAGFKYVHEKSGQGLRPAESRAPVRLGKPLRAAWSECARRAGYVRADAYCTRTRTIYPYTPRSGRNPSISVNHFFVPGGIAKNLGLCDPGE